MWIIPGARHIKQADMVGGGLLCATVREQYRDVGNGWIGHGEGRLNTRVGGGKPHAQKLPSGLGRELIAHSLCAVMSRGVGYLMTKDSGKPRFIPGDGK